MAANDREKVYEEQLALCEYKRELAEAQLAKATERIVALESALRPFAEAWGEGCRSMGLGEHADPAELLQVPHRFMGTREFKQAAALLGDGGEDGNETD